MCACHVPAGVSIGRFNLHVAFLMMYFMISIMLPEFRVGSGAATLHMQPNTLTIRVRSDEAGLLGQARQGAAEPSKTLLSPESPSLRNETGDEPNSTLTWQIGLGKDALDYVPPLSPGAQGSTGYYPFPLLQEADWGMSTPNKPTSQVRTDAVGLQNIQLEDQLRQSPFTQFSTNTLVDKRFLAPRGRSAPLRAEGKSADYKESGFLHLFSAPLRDEGKSSTDPSSQTRFTNNQRTLPQKIRKLQQRIHQKPRREILPTTRFVHFRGHSPSGFFDEFLPHSRRLRSSFLPNNNTPLAADGIKDGNVVNNPSRLAKLLELLAGVGTVSFLCHMMPGAGNPAEATHRVPPRWSPELEGTYSFRNYAQDTMMWCLTSDLQPHQQCAAIIQRLGGTARELARQMSPAELMNGAVVNGVQVDPVTMLFDALQNRFGMLQEETRLQALTAFMTFRRRPHERVNELLTRFETVQTRAETDANFRMSFEGLSYMILQVVGVSDNQLIQLLAPFNGTFPNTRPQFQQMIGAIRRMGHILENQPGNIAQSLRNRSDIVQRSFVNLGDSGQHPADQGAWTQWGQTQTDGGWLGLGTSTQGRPAESTDSGEPQYSLLATDAQSQGDVSDTSTETSSDNYGDLDFSEFQSVPEERRGEAIYWTYKQNKSKWRRFANKPTRRVRRFAKRHGGRGKGGKRASAFMATAEVQSYFKGKGKRLSKSSNKGFHFGQNRKNPKGPDGETMKCSICGSEFHFRAKCPQAQNGSSSSTNTPQFFVRGGPLDGIELEINEGQSYTNMSYMIGQPSTQPAPYNSSATDAWTTGDDPWSNATLPPVVDQSLSDGTEWDNYRRAAQENRQGRTAEAEESSEHSWVVPSTVSDVRADDYNDLADTLGPANTTWGPTSATIRRPNTVPTVTLPQTSVSEPSGSGLTGIASQFMQVSAFRAQLNQSRRNDQGRQAAIGGSPSEQPTARTQARITFGNFLDATYRHPNPTPVTVSTTPAPEVQTPPVQMFEMQRRREELRQQRQGQTQQANVTQNPMENVVIWDGEEFTCSICLDDYQERERVVRLRCRHVFHSSCWEGMRSMADPTCPNCRGSAEIIAVWNFIGPRPDPSQGQPNLFIAGSIDGTVDINTMVTPRSMVTDYEFTTPEGGRPTSHHTTPGRSDTEQSYPIFPSTAQDAQDWWGSSMSFDSTSNSSTIPTVPKAVTAAGTGVQTYISNTELADGRQALLVDPGSWNNLAGAPWCRRTAVLAGRNGLKATQTRRERPLQVSGVGKDAQTCTHDCGLPIALKTVDDRGIAALFKTPTIDDHALPALLGLKTLIEQRAIMDFTKMQISFSGPGETRIEFSPGTDTFQMYQAPSGHLMLPCCEYQSTRNNASSSSSSSSSRPSELVLHTQAPENN